MKSLLGSILNAGKGSANLPVPYTSRRLISPLGVLRRDNVAQQMSMMGSVGTLFGVVHKTSTAVAAQDWHLYRKSPSGKEDDRVEVTSHAALDLLNRPNDFYTRQALIETVQQHIDLTGEGILVIGRSQFANIPLELWPVRPDRIAPVPSAERFLAGWIYSGPDGEQVPLRLDQVIQIKMPNPLDPYRGMGPVQALLADLDSTRYSAEWNRNFFMNSAVPGGIVQVDRHLSDDEFTQMTERWAESHRGVANAHRVGILEFGEWKETAFSMRDMQFSELRAVSRDTILEGFGFPKSELGITEDVNLANAKAGAYMFASKLTVPRLERWKQALCVQLLPLFGSTGASLEFDYDSPVPEDEEADNASLTARSTAFATFITAGVDPADAAEVCDLPPMKMIEKPVPPALEPFAGGDPAGLPSGTEPKALPPGQVPADPQAVDNSVDLVALQWAFDLGRQAVPANAAAAQVAGTVLTAEVCTCGDGPLDDAVPALGVLAPPPSPRAAVEQPGDVNIQPAQDDWKAQLEALMAIWLGLQAVQAAALLAQIVKLVDAGHIEQLVGMTVDSEETARELHKAMVTLAEASAEHVVREAETQGVTDIVAVVPDAESLEVVATTTARMLAAELSLSAGREALRVHGDKTGIEVADVVREHLESVSEAPVRAQVGGALTVAQNEARKETLLAGPLASLYASEQNDSATCKFCKEIDGRFIGLSADEQTTREVALLYPNGGYVNCLGRERCRGTIVGVWRPKRAREAAAG